MKPPPSNPPVSPSPQPPDVLMKGILAVLSKLEPKVQELLALPEQITLLCESCQKSGRSVAELLDHTRDDLDNNALICAAIQGEPLVVVALLKAGANPRALGFGPTLEQSGAGAGSALQQWNNARFRGKVVESHMPAMFTPLMAAVEAYLSFPCRDYFDIIDLLRQAGAEIDQQDLLGRTALSHVCFTSQMRSRNAWKMAAFLLGRGADPGKTSHNGCNALMWAVAVRDGYGGRTRGEPSPEMVELLLPALGSRSSYTARSGVWARDSGGQTAFDLLRQNGLLSHWSKRSLAAPLMAAMFSPASWQGGSVAELEMEWHRLPRGWRLLGAEALRETRRSIVPATPRPRRRSGNAPGVL